MAIKWYTQKHLCVHDDQEFNFVKVTKAYSSKDYFQKINYMKGHLLIYESCIALAHSEHSFFLIFPICFEERIDYTAEFMAKKKRQRSKEKNEAYIPCHVHHVAHRTVLSTKICWLSLLLETNVAFTM